MLLLRWLHPRGVAGGFAGGQSVEEDVAFVSLPSLAEIESICLGSEEEADQMLSD